MPNQGPDIDMKDLPEPERSGTLPALRSYFSEDITRKRVAFRLGYGKEDTDRVLANLYEVVETAEDPATLLACDPRSLITSCIQAHQVGLSIDKRGHAWVVPYYNKNKGVKEAQMQIGWRGYVYRLCQKLESCKVHVDLVHEGDEFTIYKENNRETYIHKPANPFSTGKEGCVGAYCYIEYTDDRGDRASVVGRMSIDEIQQIAGIAKSNKVWGPWWGEQAKKSVIKRTCKVQFSSITSDLDKIDNENYDLSKAHKDQEGSARRASTDDIEARMGEEDELIDVTPQDSPEEPDKAPADESQGEEVVGHLDVEEVAEVGVAYVVVIWRVGGKR